LRTAELVAIAPCTLLCLSKERFATFVKLAPEMRESGIFDSTITRRTANSLKAIPLFGFLQKKKIGPLELFDENKLQLLGQLFKFQQYDNGVTIFSEGEKADTFFIIVRGSVEVKTTTGTSSDGKAKEIMLNRLLDNDWFGEIALIKNTVRTATVVTTSKCVMLKLHTDDFQKFLTIAPESRETFEQIISVRTSKTLQKIPIFKSVKENKPWSKLAMLGAMFQFVTFPEGHVIYTEGDPNTQFYVIVDGKIELSTVVYPVADAVLGEEKEITESDFLSEKEKKEKEKKKKKKKKKKGKKKKKKKKKK